MRNYELTGCFISLLIISLIFFLVKELWWLGIIVILIYLIRPYIIMLKEKLDEKKAEKERFKPEAGQSYKVCPYCGEKVRVTELKCPKCGRELG